MKKIVLNLDALQVETFDTAPRDTAPPVGTVRAREATESNRIQVCTVCDCSYAETCDAGGCSFDSCPNGSTCWATECGITKCYGETCYRTCYATACQNNCSGHDTCVCY